MIVSFSMDNDQDAASAIARGSSRIERYCLISPARNEAEYISDTLDSVLAQTVLPKRWIIIDDGSTDETPQILAAYAAKHDFIEIHSRADRGRRALGGGVV